MAIKNTLVIFLGFMMLAGCATVGPVLRANPRGCEAQAKDMVAKIANAWASGDTKELARWDKDNALGWRDKNPSSMAELNLEQEAAWISPREVMIRASWGPANRRRMTNFIFNVDEPMVLKKIEGDKPI